MSNKGVATKSYWAQWNLLIAEDSVRKQVWESASGIQNPRQILRSASYLKEVLRSAHSNLGVSHLGKSKTLEKVRERFYWLSYKSQTLSTGVDDVKSDKRKDS